MLCRSNLVLRLPVNRFIDFIWIEVAILELTHIGVIILISCCLLYAFLNHEVYCFIIDLRRLEVFEVDDLSLVVLLVRVLVEGWMQVP